MNQKECLQQGIKNGRTLFNNVYTFFELIQDQYEKAASVMFDQINWLPSDQRKTMDGYVEAYKESRNRFKSYIDESYSNAEALFR